MDHSLTHFTFTTKKSSSSLTHFFTIIVVFVLKTTDDEERKRLVAQRRAPRHSLTFSQWRKRLVTRGWRLVQPPARVHRLSAFTAVGTRTTADAAPPGWGNTFKKNDKKITKKVPKRPPSPTKTEVL